MVRRFPAGIVVVVLFIVSPALRGQLDPNSFSAIGQLSVASGTITIDTDALTLKFGSTTFAGVAEAQSGGPPIAVFDFSGIAVSSGVLFNVVGSRPLALLSRGDAMLPGISVSALYGSAIAGGYLGGTAVSPNPLSRTVDFEPGTGPGPGVASINLGASGGGYGGQGGLGVNGPNFLTGGVAYGGLPQILQGGSGGGAASNTGITNIGGSGGGGVEVAAAGNLTIGNVSANGSDGGGGSNGTAGGGAGGSILLSAGGKLTLGTLNASGGAGSGTAATSGAGGGGGGRIMVAGNGDYTLGNPVSGVTANGGGSTSAITGINIAGAAGVITVDYSDTTIGANHSVTLDGTPVFSVSGNGQTSPNVVAYVRHNLFINLGKATLGMDNALYTTPGLFTANVTVEGTFDLNGFSQIINQLNGGSSSPSFPVTVNVPGGSTLTVGNGDGNGGFGGQFGFITGNGALVKTGAGTQSLNGTNSFSGPTTVTGGALALANDMCLPNSTITLAGGTLSFPSPSANPMIGSLAGTSDMALTGISSLTVGGNNASTTYTGNLTGTAALIKAGSGTFTLGGTSASGSFAGATMVNAGILAVASNLVLQNSTVTLSGGSLAFAAGAANPVLGALAGTSNLNLTGVGSLMVGGDNDSTTFSGSLNGNAAFVKTGTGTMTIVGNLGGQYAGPIAVSNGMLAVGDDTVLSQSVVTLNGGTLAFVSPAANPSIGALAGSTALVLIRINGLSVGGNNATTTYAGSLTGSLPDGLSKVGTGTWTLAGNVNFSGPLTVVGGTVMIDSAGVQLSNWPLQINSGATLDSNGFNMTVSSLSLSGLLKLGGASLSLSGPATYGGQIANGILANGTHTIQSGGKLSAITTAPSTTVNAQAGSIFDRITNGGSFNISGATAPAQLNEFTNEGSGTVMLTAGSMVSAADFQSYGTVTMTPGTASAPTRLTNTATTPLYFNGGSRTFIGTPGTATQFLAGLDLHGQNAVVAGGLFVNNGVVGDSSNSGAGTGTIIADFGALVKGAGFFQNSIITQNGGRFQAGNSPGAPAFGYFVLGPGGVNNYVFAINDAAGTPGPNPDALGYVSGWSLVRSVIASGMNWGPSSRGDFTWSATPADKLTVALDTLVNSTIVGIDVAGPMDHFNPSQPYSWPAFEWTGSYAGPAIAAELNAATTFDTSGFVNSIGGVFGWQLDSADHTLALTYTPVPEPDSLILTALACLGLAVRRRRRNLSACGAMIVGGMWAIVPPAAYAQLDPNSFTNIGGLTPSSAGPVTFNTDTLVATGNNFTYNGVSFVQPGGPPIAVFDFSSLSLPSGSTVSIVGSRPLAILCRGDITLPAISVSAATAGTTVAGGFLGGTAVSPNSVLRTIDPEPGAGPGAGGVSLNLAASGAGYGGLGGGGGGGVGEPVGGVIYGGLPQVLQGGSGGGAVSNSGLTNFGGAGGGAIEVVATGNLTIGNVFANGSAGDGGANGYAGGGAGGAIVLSAGGSLTMTGSLQAQGGAGSGSVGNGASGGGGGGGRILMSGLDNYFLGNQTFVNCAGGLGTSSGILSNNGAPGVVTVDARTTWIQSGQSIVLNGTPVFSLTEIAQGNSGTTVANVSAYVRHSLFVETGAAVTVGMNNPLYTAPGAYNAGIVLGGTLNLNGFNLAIDQLNDDSAGTGIVQIPAGSTLTLGTGNGNGVYQGQITGTGRLVKTGSGNQSLVGALTFSGPIIVTGGSLVTSTSLAFQNSTLTLAGGTVSFDPRTPNYTFGGLAGMTDLNLSLIGSLTVGGNNASTCYSGNLPGSAAIVKVGTGTWTLGGVNSMTSFNGPVTVSAGTLALANDLVLQNSVVTLSGGALAFAPGALNPVLGELAGTSNVNLAGINSLTVADNNTLDAPTFSGSFIGNAAFVKTGIGLMNIASNLGGQYFGPVTISGGRLLIENAQALANSIVTLAGGTLLESQPNVTLGALAGNSNLNWTSAGSLTVGDAKGDSATYGGTLSGSIPNGGLFKIGPGTWTLTGSLTYNGNLTVMAGTVAIGSGTFAMGDRAITINSGGVLEVNGYNLVSNNRVEVNGLLALGGGSMSVSGADYFGQAVNGMLVGGSHTVNPGAILSEITTYPSTRVSALLGSTFNDFKNGGVFLTGFGSGSPIQWNRFTNQGSGSITINPSADVFAADLQSFGVLTLNDSGRLLNTGFTPIYLNSGSRTFIGAVGGNGQAQLNLNGKNAIVAGGLFVNNGSVVDGSNNGTGTATVIADFGSLVKGAGFFQNSVITQNGGKFQAGNSPGVASFGRFIFGPGGVDSDVFAIDDATGTAGPSPDALGHVSGWSLVRSVIPTGMNAASNLPGDFTWTATPAQKLSVALDTLVNPTTVGSDALGPMADFDPARPYSWPAVEWAGTYSGPTDVPALDASTSFDLGGFANPVAGTFGWALDLANRTLSLTYTPAAVPEPGTAALTALAALGWAVGRRKVSRSERSAV